MFRELLDRHNTDWRIRRFPAPPPQVTLHSNALSGGTNVQANLTKLGASWRRTIGLQWGYLVGTFTVEDSEEKLSEYMHRWLGYHLQEKRSQVTWEGIVVELTLNSRVVRRRSLDEVWNKVAASYITDAGPQLTDFVSDVASQSRFGIKEYIVSGNNQEQADAERLRDSFLAEHAWPAVERVSAGREGPPYLEGVAIGYGLTTDWQFTQHEFAVVDEAEVPEESGALMTTLLAESQYIASATVAANTNTVLLDVDKRRLKTSIEDVVEKGGGGGTYWRVFVTTGRQAIYEPIDFGRKYVLLGGEIRTDKAGPVVDPHLVTPGIVRDLAYPRGADYPDSPYRDRRDFLLREVIVDNGSLEWQIGDFE